MGGTSPPRRCRCTAILVPVLAGCVGMNHALTGDAADAAVLRDSTSAPICSNFSLGNVCCSLNGELKGDSCVCDLPWDGENCEIMRFKPHDHDGQPAYGTPPVFDSSGKRVYYGNFTWGGNPVYYNKMFHLAELISNSFRISLHIRINNKI